MGIIKLKMYNKLFIFLIIFWYICIMSINLKYVYDKIVVVIINQLGIVFVMLNYKNKINVIIGK